MATINEHIVVRCPYARAKEYLHQLLDAPASSGAEQTLLLTTQEPMTGIELAKGVAVRYAHAVDPMHFDEPFRVSWRPQAGGIYPTFDGVLTVRADERYETSLLELQGEYEPPLGAPGRVFDAAFGNRIAADTATRLLRSLAGPMEELYQKEEALKR